MVNRERFLLDVDSEGFPLGQRIADVPLAQTLLADAKCRLCNNPDRALCPEEYAKLDRYIGSDLAANDARVISNPPGWQEVDGVKLPPITWASAEEFAAQYSSTEVNDRGGVTIKAHDGITRLSDSYAPDAFYGWKR